MPAPGMLKPRYVWVASKAQGGARVTLRVTRRAT